MPRSGLVMARSARWRGPWSAVQLGWSRAAWSAIRPGQRLLRAGASEGTGIIAMSIIADIRRENPFARLRIRARRRSAVARLVSARSGAPGQLSKRASSRRPRRRGAYRKTQLAGLGAGGEIERHEILLPKLDFRLQGRERDQFYSASFYSPSR